jgi:hypothetical protein
MSTATAAGCPLSGLRVGCPDLGLLELGFFPPCRLGSEGAKVFLNVARFQERGHRPASTWGHGLEDTRATVTFAHGLLGSQCGGDHGAA